MYQFFVGLFSVMFHKVYSFARSLSLVQNAFRIFMKKAPHSTLSLPKVADVEKVSQRVYRILGQNPGFHTLQGTNIYLITGVNTDEHVLIDTGETVTASKFIDVLFDQVFPQTKTKRISKIILTHGHSDHQGGVKAILQALKQRQMEPLPTIYKRKIPDGEKYPCEGFECENIEDESIFQVGEETTLKAIYTPGHTDDHVAFILQEDKALLSGDCVLGCGTTVFDDLYDYLKSLHKLLDLIRGGSDATNPSSPETTNSLTIDKIYPGHGPVIGSNAVAKIEEYIAHRLQRESQIITALQNHHNANPTNAWISSWSLVPIVYGKLPSGVYLSAQSNLVHHLEKLRKDEKVESAWPDLWKLADKTVDQDSSHHHLRGHVKSE